MGRPPPGGSIAAKAHSTPVRAGATSGGVSPIDEFRALFERASASEPFDATRAALATATATGEPSVRFVLVKEVDERGFSFFTNYESRKGEELAQNPRAALAWHWASIDVQVRAEGPVRRLPPEESDRYFATRPLESRRGAWASPQSRPIAALDDLHARVEDVTARFGEDPPRPPYWGGFLLEPLRVELWFAGAARLHRRVLYQRRDDAWTTSLLAP